ncbi:MAG TPA: hypothetical protein VF884_12525 [Nitrososphaeraceae archaeon]
MAEMTEKEARKFLMKGTFKGKLATVGKDGNSHVVPICFVLEDRPFNGKIGDIYLQLVLIHIRPKTLGTITW